jgi:hypothetical protein
VTERVIIPLGAMGVLVLDGETFRAALAEGARLTAAATSPAPPPAVASPKLLSAEQMEVATGVPASWFAAQARERRIPCTKIGRYVRFSLDEILVHERFQRRAIAPGQLNCTGPDDRKG